MNLLKYIISAFLIFLMPFLGFSQDEGKSTQEVIQFTGVVLDQDSAGVPGVHIYTPVFGRGTSTNSYGFFSMPALEGDSLIISAVGFKKSKYIIPQVKGQTLKVIFTLKADTTVLNEVQVYNLPPTADAFKKAILAMQLPTQYDNINKNMDPAVLKEMYMNLPADGSMNHRWFVQQQAYYDRTRNSVPVNPLLNPMAWVELFRSIKRGDFNNNNN
ncbi:carboxypeptidase-like regulatory domain-containing protein [Marivirga sp. S37H4]|uniref:Carboxypeptidase-like regulatory domain-containing protein n=1 Tax=Marivirga aurantiaca TaxID=2802615 RepID=A0A934X2B7_9BACT|nr:carboxypeptidase-like regulatory domain-containing protein [Marivirga aurantiaca]MBK6267171.1 carboxypeptidase-like regulatory domain-containing protein [Marivirga aurantiaca]